MHILSRAAFGALLLAPAAIGAQTAPAAPAAAPAAPAAAPTVGATVYDSAGASLGTIEQVTPQAIVVNIGTAKVGLPPASIGTGPRGLQVSTTRAEIEAQAQGGARQQLQAQLVTGATVSGAAGASVGTVKAVDAQNVTLTTPRGDIKLPVAGFGPGPNGPVIGLTAAQLDAAITQAGGAAGEATAPAATATPTDAATPGATATPEAAPTAATRTVRRTTRTRRTRTTTTRD